MNKIVEVPEDWIKRLLEIKRNLVKIRVEPESLIFINYLFGYIDSAETFIKK